MDSSESYHKISYKKHSEYLKRFGTMGKEKILSETWFRQDTVDAWRHQRMYKSLDPILNEDPNATWLTVGDGRYGTDSKYISEKGGDVLASDLSDLLLQHAKKMGFIKKYKKENAESLSFKDNEFDYILCKESYHHFPRPMTALYEMLRVSKKGVILIEPNDNYIKSKALEAIFHNVKNTIKFILRKKKNKYTFEESGNFVYCISKREIEKTALGLNYKIVAFKGINDAYSPGVEYEKLSDNGPIQKKIKRLIKKANCLCKLGFKSHAILAAIIFKKIPSKKLIEKLTKNGYEVVYLPENPYS
jgi:ubiquinone/menaquinone biosynthesis C-methylase UbiE